MIRHRLMLASVLLLSPALAPAAAVAGCVCQCIEGEFKPSCTSTYDIPPICSLRTCPFVPRAGGPILGAGASSRCKQVRTCDAHGFCSTDTKC